MEMMDGTKGGVTTSALTTTAPKGGVFLLFFLLLAPVAAFTFLLGATLSSSGETVQQLFM